jgi:hypothetical protein
VKSRIIASLALFAAFVLGLLSFHPIARAVESFAVTTCQGTKACIGGSNTGKGPGVQGSSAGSYGLSASTAFASTSATKFSAGAYGLDSSTTGKYDAGVWGKSTRGDGVYGSSSSGPGVEGVSSSSVGVIGSSSKNTGVYGVVSAGNATPNGVFGADNTSNTNGAGVVGQSNVGTGVVAETASTSANGQALVASAPNGAYVFAGAGAGNYEVATIDGNGNIQISGQIYTSGACSGGCARHHVRSYGASAATPTLEDTGEAELRAGTAYVRLDSAFANAADLRQGYFVLITPEGDTRGLYVTQRTAAGFSVRESQSGRSNATFAYRIVAHPFGAQSTARLPLVENKVLLPQRAADLPAQRQVSP